MPTQDEEWELPPYLRHIYGWWELVGHVLKVIDSLHHGMHAAINGYEDEGVVYPPDTVMKALSGIVLEPYGVTLHEVLEGARSSVYVLLMSTVTYMKEADMMPPWWSGELYADSDEEEDGEE